jgi:Major Facilitator Superfamily
MPSTASFVPAARTYLMRAADALASATAAYAIPLLVLVTTGSTALTGVAFVLEWTPRVAAFGFAGGLVDRWGAGRVFRLCNFVRATVVALAGAVLSVLPATGAVTTAVVMFFGAVAGLLAQVSFVAVESLGAEASRRLGEHAHRAQSVRTGIDQGASLVGPLLGGLLLLADPSVLLAAVAVLALIAAFTAGNGDRSAQHHSDAGSSLLTGWRTVRRTAPLAWLVGGLAASNLTLGVLQAATPITVIRRFHHSTGEVGLLWSGAAVVSLLTVIATRWAIDRWNVWSVGATAAAMATGCCLATALVPGFPPYAVGLTVFMAADGTLTVVLRSLRSRLIPAAGFGSTLAVTIILLLLPLPLAGALVAAVPVRDLPQLLLACALVQGAALGACFYGLRRHRAAYAPTPFQNTRAPSGSKSALPADAP